MRQVIRVNFRHELYIRHGPKRWREHPAKVVTHPLFMARRRALLKKLIAPRPDSAQITKPRG